MALAVTKGSRIAQAGLAKEKCVPEERQLCAVELLSALQGVRLVPVAHLLPPAVVYAPLQWPVTTTHTFVLSRHDLDTQYQGLGRKARHPHLITSAQRQWVCQAYYAAEPIDVPEQVMIA